jgi:hypothetical protein
MSWLDTLERFVFGGLVSNDQRDLKMSPIEESGWQIHRDKGLISHHSGFRAEFRDHSIYSIKQFPYEATIHDIRNWVMKAEQLLCRIHQSG